MPAKGEDKIMPATLLALSLVAAQAPPAPDAPQATPSDPAAAVEIVTVRGRPEQRARTPASVDRVELEGSSVQIDDLPVLSPGVWLVNDQDPGTNILSIRAATTDRLQQASVVLVQDGVPLADTELFTLPLFDQTAAEILKGPQGGRFGKNAAGGVIAFSSVRPVAGSGAQDGFLAAGIGNGGLGEASFGITLAPGSRSGDESDPRGGVRIAGLWRRSDGWITNRTLGKTVDGMETVALRLIGRLVEDAAARDGGAWSIEAGLSWMEEEGGAAWASSGNITGLAGGRLSGAVLQDPIGDYEGRAWRRWFQGRISAHAGDPQRTGQLSVVVARDSYAKRWSEELDYRPGPLTFFGFPAFPNGIQPISQPIDLTATTGELRYRRDSARPGSNSSLEIGLFRQETQRFRIDDFGPLLFGAPPPAYRTDAVQTGLFASAILDVGDLVPTLAGLTLEVQGRHDRDERSQTITTSTTGALIERRSGTFERFQPRLALGWRFEPLGADSSGFVYASASQAFRPGGFNPAPGPASIWTATFRPEITRAQEIGLKLRNRGEIGADRSWSVSLDLAVFDNRVRDFQNYTFIDNQSVTLSVPRVTVRGWEMAAGGSLDLGGQIVLTGSLGYAHNRARIGRFIATDPLLGSPATRDYSGRQVPNAPEWTGSADLELSAPVGAAGQVLSVGVRLNGAGRTVYELDNVLVSPARTWVDLEARLEWNAHWTLALVARNATDERWAVSAFGQGMVGLLAGLGPGGPFDTYTINRGRQTSLTLRRSF
jgi:iron complex outermembrane recepter protein